MTSRVVRFVSEEAGYEAVTDVPAAMQADADLERDVLDWIKRNPGASKRAIRAGVGKARPAVNGVLDDLVERYEIEVVNGGYHLAVV